MGQDRMVRVVNFVSRASIEERILGLLQFKKSLFAGVLDEDGADVVMVGEAGMEKFIQSVEEAVAPLATPDPELERQEQIEAAADEQAAEKRELSEDGPPAVVGTGIESGDGAAAGRGPGISTGGGTGDGAEALNTLLVSGAQFLMSLSKAIARPAGVQDNIAASGDRSAVDGDGAPSLQKALQGVLGRDEATGKTYLKIPMPDAEAMTRIVSGLGQLLSGFMNR